MRQLKRAPKRMEFLLVDGLLKISVGGVLALAIGLLIF